MLHMEHRNPLMYNHFYPLRRHRVQYPEKLPDIQVKPRSHPFSTQLMKVLDRRCIRDIQREVGQPIQP